MEITITPNGGEGRFPLKIGENINIFKSELEDEMIKKYAKENPKINNIDYQFDSNENIQSLKLNIPDIINIDIENGDVKQFVIKIPDDAIQHSEYTEKTKQIYHENAVLSKSNSDEKEIPPVPEINTETLSEDDYKRYNSLSSENTQPYKIRKIIFGEGEITRAELKKQLQKEGYESIKVGESHTGVNSTLRVLDNFTNEIERDGRGENKTLRWNPT